MSFEIPYFKSSPRTVTTSVEYRLCRLRGEKPRVIFCQKTDGNIMIFCTWIVIRVAEFFFIDSNRILKFWEKFLDS